MSDEDRFVHAILQDPDQDAPRLRFAHWLAEHGRESHAELIGVQCELARLPKRNRDAEVTARRKELAEREKTLLRQPEFYPRWPTDLPKPPDDVFMPPRRHPNQKYERGFITRASVLDGELMALEWWDVSPLSRLLCEGKLLALEIATGQGGFYADYPICYEMADLANHPALCRVTRISAFEGDITDDNLGVLARSPSLTQLREVWLGDCNIHPGAIEALVTSPSIKQLRSLHLCGFYIPGARGENKKGFRLWELVASSPNMASLERLLIDWGGPLETRTVEALIRSPYLKQSLRLDLSPSGEPGGAEGLDMLAKLSPAKKKAFLERFPENRF
jgi:uncharacterized protein (TIGR02996 family)